VLARVKYNAPPAPLEDVTTHAINVAGTTIPIPNPFKSRKPRAARPLSVYDLRKNEEGLIELEKFTELTDPQLDKEQDMTLVIERLAVGEPVIAYTDESVKVGGCE